MMNSIKTNVSCSVEAFWKALRIYFERPNSINKQVILSENILVFESSKLFSENECLELYQSMCESLNRGNDLIEKLKNNLFLILFPSNCESLVKVFESNEGMFLLLRTLIPKYQNNWNYQFYEFFFLDKSSTTVVVYTFSIKASDIQDCDSQKDPYTILKYDFIELGYYSNTLQLQYNCSLGEKGGNWLSSIFVPKFTKLMINSNQIANTRHKSAINFSSQVDVVEYYQLYDRMKKKYAKQLIENWCENTDPKKFVYEDIGIATYLLMIWNKGETAQEKKKKIKFVDLGCGNGLLVYILNSEGHLGVGLDIRKRKIWDTYSTDTILKEETIIPTANTSYPEADWLIGNHSDELTAWIPIMARRSNRTCRYFVLPCCPYQLNGKKFQRKNSDLSCYQDFINYVRDLSEICGFETYVDKLRIPSTKRICLIGCNKQVMSTEKFNQINNEIVELIRNECEAIGDCGPESERCAAEGKAKSDMLLNFKVRESVETVKNCTKVPKEFINQILHEIMKILLKKPSICCVTKENKTLNWNRGEKLAISELARNIDEQLLKKLKEENKGLQTLLKNHRFIFEVNQGLVQFRSPDSMLKISEKCLNNDDEAKWKKRFCWFYNNHPDKCPLPDEKCSYKHEIQQI